MKRKINSTPQIAISHCIIQVHLIIAIGACICAYEYVSSSMFDKFCQAPCIQQISPTEVRLWFNELVTWRFATTRVKFWNKWMEQDGNETLYYWKTKTVGNENSDFVDIQITPNENYSFQLVSEANINASVIKSCWSLITKMHTLD